jgi:hypothetical protein
VDGIVAMMIPVVIQVFLSEERKGEERREEKRREEKSQGR